MTDRKSLRQRHDIPWSQPLPLEPRTLADDPLPERDWRCLACQREHQIAGCRNCEGFKPPLRPAAQEPTAEPAQPEPVPMVLHCPECKARHIDEGPFATKPHHTHSCQGCGLTWRPAVVPTVGVQFLPGFKNEEPVDDEPSDRDLSFVLWEAWYSKKWGEAPTDAEAPYAWLPSDFDECARAAKAALLGVRREAVTQFAIAQAVCDATRDWQVRPTYPQQLKVADAVLALFGAEPKGQPEHVDLAARVKALEADSKNHFRLITELYTFHDEEKPDDRLDALERAVEGLTKVRH